MLKVYCKISKKCLRLISTLSIYCLVLTSCQIVQVDRSSEPTRLTERELVYQKGLALFENEKYAESSVFFAKVTQSNLGPNDSVYNESLWKLSSIYEKMGEAEKAILALLELEKRKPTEIPLFRIQLALEKNYLRLENKELAFKIGQEIENSNVAQNYSLQEIYQALEENSKFNYDHLILEELQFLGQIQKYFVYVMESQEAPINQKATELLIQIYEGFFKKFNSSSLNYSFKRTLSIDLLDRLRKFDYYKMNSNNLNPNTISKFSKYNNEKQNFLTDWLHQ